MASTLIKDQPFIQRSGLTDRWYFVRSWRDAGNGVRMAHEKFDITDDIDRIRKTAQWSVWDEFQDVGGVEKSTLDHVKQKYQIEA